MTDHTARKAGLTVAERTTIQAAKRLADSMGNTWLSSDLETILAAHSGDARNGEGVVQGWKLVPEIATREMQDAFNAAPFNRNPRKDFDDAYAAMLLAAPAAPAPTVPKCSLGCTVQCKADEHGCPSECVSTKTRRALQSAPAPAAQADERSYDMALERLVLARQFMPADKQDAFDQAWDKRRSELRATRQQSAPTAECTCPSGNGSLRYPCPAHSADAASEADKIDYSLARGDTVYSPYWGEGTRPVEVVDVNWALRAAAVRLAPKGGIVVWPVSHLQRERQQGADRG